MFAAFAVVAETVRARAAQIDIDLNMIFSHWIFLVLCEGYAGHWNVDHALTKACFCVIFYVTVKLNVTQSSGALLWRFLAQHAATHWRAAQNPLTFGQ